MTKPKTYEEFCKYMWTKYPDVPDDVERDIQNYNHRVGMDTAWRFLHGEVDREEIERKEIAASINVKMLLNSGDHSVDDVTKYIVEHYGYKESEFRVTTEGLIFLSNSRKALHKKITEKGV